MAHLNHNAEIPVQEDGKIPVSLSRKFLNYCHERAHELNLHNTTLYELVGKGFIHESTFSRLWNNQQSEPRIEFEIALRLCSALGISINDALGIRSSPSDPTDVAPELREAHADVARNTGELLSTRREEIESLQSECEELKAQLKINEIEMKRMQEEHMRRIDSLLEDLRKSRSVLDDVYRQLLEYKLTK